MAADANYCMDTGLHATLMDDEKSCMSPSGYSALLWYLLYYIGLGECKNSADFVL